MPSGSGKLKWDATELLDRLNRAPEAGDRALTAIMAFHAPRAATKMRTGARWTDRTGNARGGLFAQPFNNKPRYGIILAHRVPYGIWLEVRFSGRYAIIGPTIQTEGPEVMKTCVATLFHQTFGV